MQNKISEFYQYLIHSKYTVFFGGAGVSTESGIPDFRSQNGLYNKPKEEFTEFSPEYYLSHECLVEHPKQFFKFIRAMRNTRNYEPNITHKVLAKLEEFGLLKTIITQNIDSLHQKAGSKNVIEIHGNSRGNYCSVCAKSYPLYYIFDSKDDIPKCECGGLIRPNITLYGEEPNQEKFLKAVVEIRKAELLIIGGTSLTVFPAAQLVDYFRGKYMVVINKNISDINQPANTLFINDTLGNVFGKINELL